MAVASIIGPTTTVRGNLRGSGSLDVRGRVEGDIEVDGDVALGQDADVIGNISGAQLTIAGRVQGDLRGSEAVLLERGARVIGDLVAPRVGIAEGALVRGGVRTEGQASAEPRRALVTPVRRPAEPRRPTPIAIEPEPVAPPAPRRSEPEAAPAATPIATPPRERERERERERGDKPQLDKPNSDGAKRPPAPIVPALGKGARGKKKGKRP